MITSSSFSRSALNGFFGSVFLGLVLLLSCGAARADILTYNLSYSGTSFGNTAIGTGTITLDTSMIDNPGDTYQSTSAFVTAFSLTISGASIGNGTFRLADFIGAPFNGGFAFSTGAMPVDFSMDLAPQILDFNIFSNASNPDAPKGVDFKTIGTSTGSGDKLILTSFAPTGVPDSGSSVCLLGLALAGLVGARRLAMVAKGQVGLLGSSR